MMQLLFVALREQQFRGTANNKETVNHQLQARARPRHHSADPTEVSPGSTSPAK